MRSNQYFDDEAGEIGRAAGRDRQAPHVLEVERQVEWQLDAAGGEVDVVGERAADDLRLLVDLLRHEMAVVALVGEERAGVDLHRAAATTRLAVAVADLGAAAASAPPSRRRRGR